MYRQTAYTTKYVKKMGFDGKYLMNVDISGVLTMSIASLLNLTLLIKLWITIGVLCTDWGTSIFPIFVGVPNLKRHP